MEADFGTWCQELWTRLINREEKQKFEDQLVVLNRLFHALIDDDAGISTWLPTRNCITEGILLR